MINGGLQKEENLLVILLLVVANNIVEAELVDALGGGNDTQPVTELLLLEELLGQVLEVATREILVRDNLNLAVVEVGDGDLLAEVAGAAVDLDARLQEGGEGRRVEDLVVGGLRSVDDELAWHVSRLTVCVLYRGQKIPSESSSGPS
jgi:hypothetical protein